MKLNTTHTLNTNEKQKKSALANKTSYTTVWLAFYDLMFLQPWSRHSASETRNITKDDK